MTILYTQNPFSSNGGVSPWTSTAGNAIAVPTLLKLAGLTNNLRYVELARQALAQMQTPTGGGMMSQYPLGFGQ